MRCAPLVTSAKRTLSALQAPIYLTITEGVLVSFLVVLSCSLHQPCLAAIFFSPAPGEGWAGSPSRRLDAFAVPHQKRAPDSVAGCDPAGKATPALCSWRGEGDAAAGAGAGAGAGEAGQARGAATTMTRGLMRRRRRSPRAWVRRPRMRAADFGVLLAGCRADVFVAPRCCCAAAAHCSKGTSGVCAAACTDACCNKPCQSARFLSQLERLNILLVCAASVLWWCRASACLFSLLLTSKVLLHQSMRLCRYAERHSRDAATQ
jgi:hypothetical protein